VVLGNLRSAIRNTGSSNRSYRRWSG